MYIYTQAKTYYSCTHMCVRMHTRTYTRTHTCIHTHTQIHTQCTHMHTYMHTHTHVYTHTHTNMYTHAHTHTHKCISMHTCTHTCIHRHTQSCLSQHPRMTVLHFLGRPLDQRSMLPGGKSCVCCMSKMLPLKTLGEDLTPLPSLFDLNKDVHCSLSAILLQFLHGSNTEQTAVHV